MAQAFLILISMLLCSVQLVAESSVWKVQKGKNVFYIGGTMHILSASDFPLPKEYDSAYNDADMLVFETDIGALGTLQVQQMMMAQSLYRDGSTLQSHLSAKTYKRLSEYCVANALPMEQMNLLKPSMVVIALTSMELIKLGVSEHGVDHFYYQLAQTDHKKIEAFESIQEQINFVTTMGEGNEDAFVRYSLSDLESIKTFYDFLVKAWRNGDENKIYQKIVAEVKSKMPKIYQTLKLKLRKKLKVQKIFKIIK